MAIKKALIAFLAVSPLVAGTVFAFGLNSATIATNNKSNKISETQNLTPNVSTKYKMEELSKEQISFFNGEMPLSNQQIEFINENNNGITFHELKTEYSKTAKMAVTPEVRKEIVDNYYTNGFFNDVSLELKADGKIIKYPKEALNLIDPNDENSYQKAKLKIIELWKTGKFKLPWNTIVTKSLADEEIARKKALVLPQAIEGMTPLNPAKLAYFNGTYPLSPEQIDFINKNNGQWTFEMIQKAIAENKDAFATKIVNEKIIEQYFTNPKFPYFHNSLSQVIWNDKAVDYPTSVSWLHEPIDRAKAIIKLWQQGNFKFPWENEAKLVATKKSTLSNEKWWPTTFKTFTDNTYKNSQEVPNDLVKTERIWSKEIFAYNSDGANSYRIPGLIKGTNNNIFVNADKRIENLGDYGNDIAQVMSVSNDDGKTWSANEIIVKVETPKTKRGLIIDGTMIDAQYQENGEIKNKLIYLFNIFAENAGIPHLVKGNPWLHLEGERYFKLWIKNSGIYDSNSHVLKELKDKPGWWRMYTLVSGVSHDTLTSSSQLTATKTYVDNTYNSTTRKITGTVYENVEESELNTLETLETRKTKHSIWDPYIDTTKYYLAKNNHNSMLESYDNGKTWTNFKLIDSDIRFNPKVDYPFAANAVGNGIQLRYQTGENAHLNGRIIFPMYNYLNSLQNPHYIYSDDFGQTWKTYYLKGSKHNSSENTMIELSDGTLHWMYRSSNWGQVNRPSMSKSVDGGQTWINPLNDASSPNYFSLDKVIDGNVFIGLGTFKLKEKDYFVFSAPKVDFRKSGSVFIMEKGTNNIQEIWNFDTTGKQDFAYSQSLTVSEAEDSVEIMVIYEWSDKSGIKKDDENFPGRPHGGGIQLDKFKISLK